MFLTKSEKSILKSNEEIEIIRRNGDILGRVHGLMSDNIVEGISTLELDRLALEYIKDAGASPSFLGYNGYPNTLCVSINEVVVHGIPNHYRLKSGDVVSIDCGVYKDGFHADSAFSYTVGDVSPSVLKLLKTTYEALFKGISNAVSGKRIGDIAFEIQNHVENQGFSVVRELVGHGVGRRLHEKPEVPNYGRRSTGTKLEVGMVLAIEPMINLGKKDIYQLSDGWTIKTSDHKPSAHFEHTVVVKNGYCDVLTTFEYINKNQINKYSV